MSQGELKVYTVDEVQAMLDATRALDAPMSLDNHYRIEAGKQALADAAFDLAVSVVHYADRARAAEVQADAAQAKLEMITQTLSMQFAASRDDAVALDRAVIGAYLRAHDLEAHARRVEHGSHALGCLPPQESLTLAVQQREALREARDKLQARLTELGCGDDDTILELAERILRQRQARATSEGLRGRLRLAVECLQAAMRNPTVEQVCDGCGSVADGVGGTVPPRGEASDA